MAAISQKKLVRGRDKFNLFQPVLVLLSVGLGLLPRRMVELLFVVTRHFPTIIGVGLRYALLQRLTLSCGKCVAIFEGSYYQGLEKATIGDNVSIHPICYVNASGGLIIGRNVSIAHGTTIMTVEHDYSHADQSTRDTSCLLHPVNIGSDVWIGAGVRILAGVTIGDHVVIGAGAVVTKDIPSNSLAVGVPARVIRIIKETDGHGTHITI